VLDPPTGPLPSTMTLPNPGGVSVSFSMTMASEFVEDEAVGVDPWSLGESKNEERRLVPSSNGKSQRVPSNITRRDIPPNTTIPQFLNGLTTVFSHVSP
jgi:hypothetical protein